jgi:hypothetical protein
MEAIIDRFEGEYAVIEYDGRMINIYRGLLPKEAKEGDVLNIEITINTTETNNRKKIIQSKFDHLWED